jgi:hypothetical protein
MRSLEGNLLHLDYMRDRMFLQVPALLEHLVSVCYEAGRNSGQTSSEMDPERKARLDNEEALPGIEPWTPQYGRAFLTRERYFTICLLQGNMFRYHGGWVQVWVWGIGASHRHSLVWLSGVMVHGFWSDSEGPSFSNRVLIELPS